ncbi:hypothetical protein KUTeg_023529 [Tegillarca granosa]|uniref:G-protein coupled receptors family 1 profile domain-containing protein n=1 Tax=Tegillarca granosa TaxID=220873 RepID=A0ABQ9E2B7_TEGGR|nr:hypothetical protein KUTeg_023529 [Tegillarca granosa]
MYTTTNDGYSSERESTYTVIYTTSETTSDNYSYFNEPTTIQILKQVDNCKLDLTKAELPIVLCLTLIVNAVAIFILVKIRQKNSGTDQFMVVVLAVNDFVTTLMFMVMWIGGWITCGDLLLGPACAVLGWLASTMVMWSAWVVVTMCATRYLALVKPLYYRSNVTAKRLKIGLILTLLITLLQFTTPLTGLTTEYEYYDENRVCAYDFSPGNRSDSHKASLIVIATEGILSIACVLFFNISIVFQLKRKNSIHSETSIIKKTKTTFKQQRAAFAKVTKVVSALYLFCYGPFLVKQDELRHSITMTLLFLSPLLNPFVYVACNKRYRGYIIETVRSLQYSYNIIIMDTALHKNSIKNA